MDETKLPVLVFCAVEVIVCFFLCGLHVDIAEWWSNRNKETQQIKRGSKSGVDILGSPVGYDAQ